MVEERGGRHVCAGVIITEVCCFGRRTYVPAINPLTDV